MKGVGKKEFAALVAQNVTLIRAGLVLGFTPETLASGQKVAFVATGWTVEDAEQLTAALMTQALNGFVPNKAQAEAVRAKLFEQAREVRHGI